MAKKKLITPIDIDELSSIGNPSISPDGTKIIYSKKIVKDGKNNSSIWLASTSGKKARALTTYGKDSLAAWSPNGESVAFARATETGSQIFLLDLNGGEPTQLTNLPEGSIANIQWNPTGKTLAISFRETTKEFTKAAADKRKETGESDPPLITESVWYRFDGDGYFGHARFHVVLVDINTGRTTTAWKKDYFGFMNYAWSPKGDKLAITTNTSKNAMAHSKDARIVIYDVGSKKTSTLPNCPRGPKSTIRWSPNGKWLAWSGRAGEDSVYSTENLELYVSHAERGGATSLTGHTDFCLLAATLTDTGEASFAATFEWSKDSNEILVQLGWHGTVHTYAFDRKSGKHKQLTKGDEVISMGNLSEDGKRIALMRSSPSSPPEICVGALSSRGIKLKQVTHENDAWSESRAIAKATTKWIKSKDKTPIQCWIMKPPKEASNKKSKPAVLQIHGGPHAQYGWAFFHEFQCLASAGYTVVYANPRGSKGYGKEHCASIRNAWGTTDWVDMQAVIKMMKGHPSINGKNMGVMGGSYGGYMTNWIIGSCNDFRGAITDRCVSNLVSMGGNSDFADSEDGYFGGNFWSRPEDRWRQSPIRLFGNVETPTLIIHSEGDLRCNIEQSEQVFAALQLRGVESRFVRYPRSTSHGLSRSGPADLRKHRLNEILGWWKKHLR